MSLTLWGNVRIWAQSPAYTIPGYSVAHYTDENGLPQNSIKNMDMDHSGYLWLATEGGLVRFDGKNFRLLSKEAMGVRHPRIYLMGRSPLNGELYALSEENDRVHWNENREKPVFVPLPPLLSDKALKQWYGRPLKSALYHREISFLPTFTKKQSPHLLLNVTADSFYIVAPGHVTYRTLKKIVWETDIRRETGHIFFCQNKRLFVYSPEGIFTEITSRGMEPALRMPGFKKLIQNPGENQFFILTKDNTVYELIHDSAGKLQPDFLVKNLPSDFDVSCMIHLQKQILFIGSSRQGLLVCKKHRFKTWAADLPDQGSIFYAIFPLNDSTLLTSYNERITKNGQPDGPVPKFHTGTSYNRSVTRSKNGDYLICRYDSALIYTPDNRLLKTLRFSSLVTASLTDRSGRTWVAAVDEGICLLNDSFNVEKRFVFPSVQYVNYIFEIRKDLFLAGTRNGLFVFSVNNPHILPYPQTRGFNVRSIFRSATGHIYLCTYGDGPVMLTPYGPLRLPKDKAGYLNTAHCMLEDSKNHIWITTNKGLFYTNEADFIRYAKGIASRVYYHYIEKSSGLRTNEFNGGCQPCGLQFAAGELVFPSMNGLVVFNPDSLVTIQPTQKMAVEKVVVDDRALEQPGDTIAVQRNFKRLEIYLTTPFYGAPENLMYEYTSDTTRTDSWVPISNADGSVTFTSLPPGYSYISFRQKTRVGLGSFNYQTLVLYKPKAFWELAYFWLLALVALGVGIFLAIRLRTRTLKERNRKLAKAVNEAHRELLDTIGKLEKKNRFQQWLTSSVIHDLRGPLRFINFYTGDIRREDEESDPAQNKFLKSVYFSALKIYTYSDNLVQLLRLEQTNDFPPQKIDFMELVQDKQEQFREQAAWNGITQELDTDSDPFIYVNKAALSIIIQNLLDNSIKNFKNGRLTLSLKNTEHESIVEIRDEGPGLTDDLLRKFNTPHSDEIGRDPGIGLGIWLVKSLVAQTGGRIRFKNLPDKGLSVTLTWNIRYETHSADKKKP